MNPSTGGVAWVSNRPVARVFRPSNLPVRRSTTEAFYLRFLHASAIFFNPSSIFVSKRSCIARSFSRRCALRQSMKTSAPFGAGQNGTASPSHTCFHSPDNRFR